MTRRSRTPFATELDVLGVRSNVAALNGGAFVAGNKPSTIEKIQELLEETAAIPTLDKRQAQVVHGNLDFAMGFFLGKSLMVAARASALLTTDNHRATPQQVQQLCAWTHAVVGQLAPKTVKLDGETTLVLIFTDAAYEDDIATWGIVVIDTISDTRTALDGEIPKFLVEAWHNLGSQQVITLAEAFAALLARISFRNLLTKKRVIFWIDNEGARYSLIKGVSQTLALLQIVQFFHSCAEEDNSLHWIERVPSKSNIADLPSRSRTERHLKSSTAVLGKASCQLTRWPTYAKIFSLCPACSSTALFKTLNFSNLWLKLRMT